MKAGHIGYAYKKNEQSTMGWIRTNDLPTRERV